MASKNQTPAPKTSSEGTYNEHGPRKELSIDHLESGYDKGVSPELKDEGQLSAKTTQQQQEERLKKSEGATGHLDIQYGMEGEGGKKTD